MTTDTGTAPVMTAGASAAEIAVMREAAAGFARRFAAGGAALPADDPFGMLALPHEAAPPARRAEYIVTAGAWHLIDDQVTG